MTELDIEQIAYSLLQDAKLLGCARPDQLLRVGDWLKEAIRELQCAAAKSERMAA